MNAKKTKDELVETIFNTLTTANIEIDRTALLVLAEVCESVAGYWSDMACEDSQHGTGKPGTAGYVPEGPECSDRCDAWSDARSGLEIVAKRRPGY